MTPAGRSGAAGPANCQPGQAVTAGRLAGPGQDGDHYYDPANPTSGVIVPDTNTRIAVLNEAGDGHHVVLWVEPSDG
ncbi:hypothetical protein [Streptomyces sp. NBC_01410]|uniref:hypothetical protein n=1 Tax=Streptomyces sp. NBC_01410 TaxID=2903856 RepID=UPI00386BEF69